MPNDDRFEEPIPSCRADEQKGKKKAMQSGMARIPLRVWVIAFIAAILLFALLSFWALYLLRGRVGASGPTPTAIIWTATPSPISTASPSPVPRGTGAMDEEVDITPTPSAGISVGSYVEVAGTGGYGLSLREGPGEDYARLDVAAERQIFIVVDGPQIAGGSPWWEIRDPENEEQSWWAIGNYLQAVEHP